MRDPSQPDRSMTQLFTLLLVPVGAGIVLAIEAAIICLMVPPRPWRVLWLADAVPYAFLFSWCFWVLGTLLDLFVDWWVERAVRKRAPEAGRLALEAFERTVSMTGSSYIGDFGTEAIPQRQNGLSFRDSGERDA